MTTINFQKIFSQTRTNFHTHMLEFSTCMFLDTFLGRTSMPVRRWSAVHLESERRQPVVSWDLFRFAMCQSKGYWYFQDHMDTPRKHMKVSAKHCFSLVDPFWSSFSLFCVWHPFVWQTHVNIFWESNDSRRSTGCQVAWWLRGLTITSENDAHGAPGGNGLRVKAHKTIEFGHPEQ